MLMQACVQLDELAEAVEHLGYAWIARDNCAGHEIGDGKYHSILGEGHRCHGCIPFGKRGDGRDMNDENTATNNATALKLAQTN